MLISKEGLIDYLYTHRIIEGSCWLWTENTHQGYGMVKWCQMRFGVHRLSLFAHRDNFDIFDTNILALHKNECHNRLCFNPDHLYTGSYADNRRDASELIQLRTT